ncbi:MAG: hypothetical protein LDL33_09515 [Desulfomonile sp.]|nr:hypothetical protein [Desulfomonile sp.]
MKPDSTATDSDLSSIPGEFRENYRFLCELINCKQKNDTATRTLASIPDRCLAELTGRLNRRQARIFKDFLRERATNPRECLQAPVPVELEASIRVRKRSTWLPWEAEAIHKIELWREDIHCIMRCLAVTNDKPAQVKSLAVT